MKRFIILSLSLLSCGTVFALEEVTSANGGERLKVFLERAEMSDLNGDGVLTVDEMYEFLDTNIKDGSVSEKTRGKGGGIRGRFKGLKSRVILGMFLEESPESDINGDGVLTKEELLSYVLSQRKVINEQGEIIPAPSVASSN